MSDDADIVSPSSLPADDVDDAGFTRLLDKLAQEHQFDVREYKEASLARRIRSRMSQVHVESFADYIAYLDRHPEEHAAVFNAVLINLTGFFRDTEAWEALRREVLPRLVDDGEPSRTLRVWSAGCSTGEEAYSLAMVLSEHLGDGARDLDVKIYGTDIDEDALGTARHGLYRVEQVKDVPPHLLEKYFAREGQMFRFRRDMRRWCIFGRHNVAQDPPLSHIDLIMCRNVLIYFRSDLQDRILPTFSYALRDGGFLFLGKSESLLARSRRFVPVVLKWRIFQRASVATPDVIVPPRSLAGDVTHMASARGDARQFAARFQGLLEALPFAVGLVGLNDVVLAWNAAAASLFDIPTDAALGRKFRDLDISYRIEGLRSRIEDAKEHQQPARLDRVVFARRSGEPVHADVSIASVFDEQHEISAVVVAVLNTSDHARLEEEMARIGEQHATAVEELQSTNEELETTNEELQSTNEELETTNEELQSTNEELETTVDELQATNAELGALNRMLEERSAELRRLDAYHMSVVNSVETALIVLDSKLTVMTWSRGAASMWGVRTEDAVGRPFFMVPLGDVLKVLHPAVEAVVATGQPQFLGDIPANGPGGAPARVTLRVSRLDGGAPDSTGVVLQASAKGE